MEIDVFPYTPDRRADVEPALAPFGYGQGDAGIDAYFETLLSAPAQDNPTTFVALDAAGGFGMASILERPMLGGAARMMLYLMPQDDAEKVEPFGRALYEVSAAALAARGIKRQGILVRDEQHLVRKFVTASGFEEIMVHYTMGWEGDGTPVAVPDIEDVTLTVYEGGNPALNEGIATLWAWAFGRDPIEPVLTPPVLEAIVHEQDGWFVIAQETGSERVIGLSESGPGSFFSGIAVARSHWGTKVAEGLAAVTMNEFMTRGHNKLHSMVRKTNRASVALHERMGWSITGEGVIYISPLPA